VFNEFKANPSDPMSHFRDISTFGGCTGGPAAAIANMEILEEENLLDNVKNMGEYLMDKLQGLQAKHQIIGQVRGLGLFQGLELVSNRETKEPLPEAMVQAIVGDCMANSAVIIGATNRSLPGFNNTLCLSPAYIATKSDLDEVVAAIDGAITRKTA
jgi:taurine-pyruvate aminotransferase